MDEEAMSHLQIASNGAADRTSGPNPLHRLLMENYEGVYRTDRRLTKVL
jgi:hypothetical protein